MRTTLRGMVSNIVILLACGTFWGVSFTLTRIVMSGGGHPLAVTFWNMAFGACVIWAGLWLSGKLPKIDRAYIRFVAVLGLLGGALPSLLLFWAAQHIGAGVLSVCMATVPLMQFALSAVLRLEAFRLRRLIGLMVSMSAVWVIADPEQGAAPLFWVIIAVMGGVSYACEDAFIAAQRPKGPTAAQVLAGMVTAGMVYTAPFLVFVDPLPLTLSAPGRIEVAFVLMTLGGLCAYGAFVHMITVAGPVFAAQVAYVVTIVGVLAGVFILGESYGPNFWAAFALIILGLSLGLPGGWRRRKAHV